MVGKNKELAVILNDFELRLVNALTKVPGRAGELALQFASDDIRSDPAYHMAALLDAPTRSEDGKYMYRRDSKSGEIVREPIGGTG